MIDSGQRLEAAEAERFVRLALANVRREYPSHLVLFVQSDADLRPPRELFPAFYGSYDWHSCVHSYWLLARCARRFPDAPFAAGASEALLRALAPANVAGEIAFLQAPGRRGFEMPYGIAWLLTLAAELPAEGALAAARDALQPLEQLCAGRFGEYVTALPRANRNGVHGQSMFAMSLVLDYARARGDAGLAERIESRARALHERDRALGIHLEPSAWDFLSPALGTADLMRRVLGSDAFAAWLGRAIPEIPHEPAAEWLAPVAAPDPSDPKLVHLDGLHLSRAWMLEGVAGALPPGDSRVGPLLTAARTHLELGLASVRPEHYAGSHWLGSFAVYALSAGDPAPGP